MSSTETTNKIFFDIAFEKLKSMIEFFLGAFDEIHINNINPIICNTRQLKIHLIQ